MDNSFNFENIDLSASTFVVAGAAGVGMNAAAQLLADRGARVIGTDRLYDQGTTTEVVAKLMRRGIEMAPQDGNAVNLATTALVVSTAIEDDNPDLITARSLGVRIVHRAEVLAACVRGKRCVAVGGTSGKSTITGMLGWIFEQLGRDPFVANGAPIINWSSDESIGNIRSGQGEAAVIEADESDRSLLRFAPEFATISNISRDHFELEETVELFRRFCARTSAAVVCGPQVSLDQLGAENAVRAEFDEPPKGTLFRYGGVEFRHSLLGSHNTENALVAVSLCDHFELDLNAVAAALPRFRGIERRLQRVGSFHGAAVFDDYGHNPAKISAAWQSLAEMHGRICVVWRPHGYGPLHAMRDDLTEAIRRVCRPQDIFCVLPVYYAGGTTVRRTDSPGFVQQLREMNLPAQYVADYDELTKILNSSAQSLDAILLMGARDPDMPCFARKICGLDISPCH